MRGHLDIDQLFRHIGISRLILTPDPGKHDLFIGVFVVNAEQPVRAVRVQRSKSHVIVVIPELLQLGLGALVHHVEFRRVCGDRIAPAQQDVGIVAFGNMVIFVVAPCQLFEIIP